MNWRATILSEIMRNHPAPTCDIQAGFGPTGLPHIGTLCELIRTQIVKEFLEKEGIKVNYFLISDDLDPLRKLPSNLPDKDRLVPFLGLPVCKVPDPFNDGASFSEMAENKLIALAQAYGIECQLVRSSDAYASGFYNDAIKKFLGEYAVINNLCAETTGSLRQRTYSMIMPFSAVTGRVIEHLRIIRIEPETGYVTYIIPSEEVVNIPGSEYGRPLAELYHNEPLDQEITTSAFNGGCKLQWKADWAMRHLARNICFEMHGEDLRVSAAVARKLAAVLDYSAPVLFPCGLFLDEKGKKISKSKGNGFSLAAATQLISPQALKKFLLANPARSRRFHLNLAPVLNDLAEPKTITSLRYQKLARILTAFQPVTETAAIALLNEKYGLAGQFTTEKFRYCFQYYLACSKEQQDGLRQHEVKTFQLIASRLTEAEYMTTAEMAHIAFSVIKEYYPMLTCREQYSLLYRGLMGRPHGPNLVSWFGYHSRNIILERMHSPFVVKSGTNTASSASINSAPPLSSSKPPSGKKRKLYRDIDFSLVQERCASLSEALKNRQDLIANALSGYQCYNVTCDEITRACDLLDNIHLNRLYFFKTIYGVTSFLPLNQPIYASVCFGFIPSLMAENVVVRPPTAMHPHYKKLAKIIDLTEFSSTLDISLEEKSHFLSRRVNVTDAVIFTGTPENALKVRKNFPKETLFILNGAGHNPVVIAENADLQRAMESALRVVLYNQGQDCAGPNAILVHQRIADTFIMKLVERLKLSEEKFSSDMSRDVIVGPNTDPDHCVKMANLFLHYRDYRIYGGDINPTTGMIHPTVFSKALEQGGNYKEFFAPVFFIQPYQNDEALDNYFSHPQYHNNAMYISLFGSSDYIENRLSKKLHNPESILHNTDLHLEEKGYCPYGGKGPAASSLWADGVRITGSTLPQRDIYVHLVKPLLAGQNEER